MTEEQIKQKAEEYVGSKSCDTDDYSCGFLPSTVEEMLIDFATEVTKKLEKENAELEAKSEANENGAKKYAEYYFKTNDQLTKAKEIIRELLTCDCEKAQKNGELCLGYGGDEDEPCERCKNCIKCECGYYNLGETEKDDQLTKAKEIIKKLISDNHKVWVYSDVREEAEQFLKEE